MGREQDELSLEETLVSACHYLREVFNDLPEKVQVNLNLLENGRDSLDVVVPVVSTLSQLVETMQKELNKTRSTADPLAVASLRHDLGSSLMMLSSALEMLEPNPREVVRYMRFMKTGVKQINLWLHVDSEQEIRVSALFQLVCDFVNEEMAEKKIQFSYDSCDETIHVIPSFTTRRLYQTVRNAIKARSDSSIPYAITMSAGREGDSSVVEICDHGIGIYPSTITRAARNAGYTQEPTTFYDAICLIFNSGVSGFREMNRPGTGDGLTSTVLAAEKSGQKVALETTIYDPEGTLITINDQHKNGYVDPTKTTTGTTFKYYFPLTKI